MRSASGSCSNLPAMARVIISRATVAIGEPRFSQRKWQKRCCFSRMSTVAADGSEDGSASGAAGSAALVLVASDAPQKSNRIPIWI